MSKKQVFEIPLVFCADGKFISHSMTTMLSVINSNPDFEFSFYLVANELEQEKELKISQKLASLGAEFKYIQIQDSSFENFPIPHHFSKANYYRLLIPGLIPSPKAIYLDADIIVVDSLVPFLGIDMNSHLLAAVADPIYKWKSELGMKPDSTYFNSGMMLMNLDLWKEKSISEKAFEFIQENPQKIRFVDQCALNAVIDGDFLELPPKFNQQAILYREDFDFSAVGWSKEEQREAIDSPVLIHYTGPSKPWEYNSNHPRKSDYWKIQKESPFRLKFPEGMKWSDHFKTLFPKSFKSKIKSLFKLN